MYACYGLEVDGSLEVGGCCGWRWVGVEVGGRWVLWLEVGVVIGEMGVVVGGWVL